MYSCVLYKYTQLLIYYEITRKTVNSNGNILELQSGDGGITIHMSSLSSDDKLIISVLLKKFEHYYYNGLILPL